MSAIEAEAGLERLIRRAGIAAEAAERLRGYRNLLEKWNARVNLTGRTDWQGLGPLFEEGVWAASLWGEGAARLHLDIGSGAGFPALLIAALRPELEMDLVEPRAKRAVFLEVAARELGLKGMRVHEARLEEYLRQDPGARGWDRVSWKGLRLGVSEVELLVDRVAGDAQFWLFHARELPVKDEKDWLARMQLVRNVECPARASWHLAVFHVKQS